MVAYSFRPRFVDRIVAGLEPGELMPGMKRQTVRAPRARHARPGEVLQLYTGMRTRQCQHLGNARCVAVEPVVLLLEPPCLVIVGDTMTPAGETEAEQHPGTLRFEGVLIRWEPLTGGEAGHG